MNTTKVRLEHICPEAAILDFRPLGPKLLVGWVWECSQSISHAQKWYPSRKNYDSMLNRTEVSQAPVSQSRHLGFWAPEGVRGV